MKKHIQFQINLIDRLGATVPQIQPLQFKTPPFSLGVKRARVPTCIRLIKKMVRDVFQCFKLTFCDTNFNLALNKKKYYSFNEILFVKKYFPLKSTFNFFVRQDSCILVPRALIMIFYNDKKYFTRHFYTRQCASQNPNLGIKDMSNWAFCRISH